MLICDWYEYPHPAQQEAVLYTPQMICFLFASHDSSRNTMQSDRPSVPIFATAARAAALRSSSMPAWKQYGISTTPSNPVFGSHLLAAQLMSA